MDKKKLEKLKAAYKVEKIAMDAEIKKIWDETDYVTKLAITRYVMERIWEHANEGGSYRYLIYDRLGFGMDSYSYLYPVGMNISNEFEVADEQSKGAIMDDPNENPELLK